MTPLLTAFWVKAPALPTLGAGVTAYSRADAFTLLDAAGYTISPDEAAVQEAVTVSDLEPNHVVPNMGVIVRRGVWYPNLNS